MKSLLLPLVLLATLAAGPVALSAPRLRTMDHLILQDGQLHLVQQGESSVVKEPVKLPNQMEVLTNGMIRFSNGEKRPLDKGQKVTLDGFYLESDSLLVAMQNHVMRKDGRMFVVKNGHFQPLTRTLTLSNGTRVTAEGKVTTRDGRSVRLQDGQMFTLTGARLQGKDQATMLNGKVRLQKDGSIIPFPVDRTIVMADGTKIKGDGTVSFMNGQKLTLREGQRLTLPSSYLPPPR